MRPPHQRLRSSRLGGSFAGSVLGSALVVRWSAMRRLTTRLLESRLLRAVSDQRCEITGVKFRAGLLNALKDMVARDGVEPPTPAFSLSRTRAILAMLSF